MKIAIASEGKDLDSKIFDFAGRAPFYLVFEENKLLEVIENPFLNKGGVGFKIPKFFKNKNIDLFVAGNFGGNMEGNLKQQNIMVKEAKGLVRDFLENAKTKN